MIRGTPLSSQRRRRDGYVLRREDLRSRLFRLYLHWAGVTTDASLRSPSDSIVLVREFLRCELKRLGAEFELVTMGPSPMHADFTLQAGVVDADVDFSPIYAARPGYDRIDITYNESRFADDDEALGSLWQDLAGEAQAFYYLVRVKNHRWREWTELRPS